MTRLTEEERRLIETGRRRRARRAKQMADDYGEPIDADHDEVSRHTNPFFTITHNDFPCSSCGRGTMICHEQVVHEGTDQERHRKGWHCDNCRHMMTGYYTTYLISEEP